MKWDLKKSNLVFIQNVLPPAKSYNIMPIAYYTHTFCRDKPSYISKNGWTKSCHATCKNNTYFRPIQTQKWVKRKGME